jgi:hypothetical protein
MIPSSVRVAVLFLLIAAAARAETVAFPKTPPEVQKAIQAQLTNSTLGQIMRAEREGESLYVVSIARGGQFRDYTFSEDGVLLTMEVSWVDLPFAVKKTMTNIIGQNKIQSVDKTMDEPTTRYDIVWKSSDGATHSLSLLENGAIESVDIPFKEIPAAAQGAITREVGSGNIKDLFKAIDGNATFFEVLYTRDSVERNFTVGANGHVESRQTFLTELPAGAQTTLSRIVGKGKVVRIYQTFEKKQGFPFHVQALVDGKPYDFKVNGKGQFLGAE